MCWHRCQTINIQQYYWGCWANLWLDIPCWSGGGRTLLRGVRPFLRSKELTERWVCPFSCCEWRDHLYSSTLPVARPGNRGGRWLTPLSFFTPAHPKTRFRPPPRPGSSGPSLWHPPRLAVLWSWLLSFSCARTPQCCAVYSAKPRLSFE